MDIKVVRGKGTGSTEISAFDSALKSAGIYNYNLIVISSIIPPGSKVTKVRRYITSDGEYGHKLFIIKADKRSNETGKFIAAGLGWYQAEDGRGVFVEHALLGDTKVAVQSEINLRIKNSLKDLCRFRKFSFHRKNAKSLLSIIQIKDQPTCVLVIAVFKSEEWT